MNIDDLVEARTEEIHTEMYGDRLIEDNEEEKEDGNNYNDDNWIVGGFYPWCGAQQDDGY